MPRSRGGSAPARRPTPPPSRPAATGPSAQQTRPASTAAHPPAQQQAPPAAQGSQGPGLFGQMASTAAGVAVGSSIGHAVGGWFSGGNSAPAEVQQAAATPQQASQFDQMAQNGECATELRMFKECAAAYGGDQAACKFPLDTLMNCFKGQGSGAQW